jgi:hypothetical protein
MKWAKTISWSTLLILTSVVVGIEAMVFSVDGAQTRSGSGRLADG